MDSEYDPQTGLPIGHLVSPLTAAWPGATRLAGRAVTLVPLDPAQHADDLWQRAGGLQNAGLWVYMSQGPFENRGNFDSFLSQAAASKDPLFFAILNSRARTAVGLAAFLRISPEHRVIEVGSILYTADLQRSRGATEAMYLMARYVFEELGYRRYEWKCNALNQKSRQAALRLGFTFEGIFRSHMIIKGRNRDTAWFSMLESEWVHRKRALERWLGDQNFDANGNQREPLKAFMD